MTVSPETKKVQTTTETDKKTVEAQEEIVFSDKHSLDEYLIGK